MGIIERLSRNADAPEQKEVGGLVKLDGRERVRKAASELAKAVTCVSDLETRLHRLTTIVRDADTAHAALQDAIAADGGVTLAAFGAGQAYEQPIARLVSTNETATRAASAAKDALPGVEDMLAKARAEVTRLDAVRFDAVIVYLKTKARDEYHRNNDTFAELSRLYDELCGIAIAVSATGHSDMMTTGAPIGIHAPGFNMGTGPAHGPSEVVTMTHTPGSGEARYAQSTAQWMAARERLIADPEADLDDLI